jgi:hypothetical protein
MANDFKTYHKIANADYVFIGTIIYKNLHDNSFVAAYLFDDGEWTPLRGQASRHMRSFMDDVIQLDSEPKTMSKDEFEQFYFEEIY